MQKILPFLWFNDNAGEAVKFYRKVFTDFQVLKVRKHGRKVVGVTFRVHGMEIVALNGGDHYKFTPAISLFVRCKDQREVDRLWNKLVRGGTEMRCGWLTDQFGVTWQIIPGILDKLLGEKDPVKAGRTWEAMMKMKKLDIKELQRANAGK